jgi:Na+/melibiose symporter-like transporter
VSEPPSIADFEEVPLGIVVGIRMICFKVKFIFKTIYLECFLKVSGFKPRLEHQSFILAILKLIVRLNPFIVLICLSRLHRPYLLAR